jgi:hypothetical protein
VARVGDPAPGLPGGVVFASFEWVDGSLDASDVLVFSAWSTDPSSSFPQGHITISRWDPISGLALLDSVSYNAFPPRSLFPPVVANGTVFYLKGTAITGELFAVEPEGAPQRVIGPGDVLPDGSIVANARIVQSVGDDLRVSDGGAVALFVEREHPSPWVSWALVTIDADGALAVRLRRDDPAPGSDGATFDAVRRIVDFDHEGTLVLDVDIDAGPLEPAQYRSSADSSLQPLVYLRGLRSSGVVDSSASRAGVVDSINPADTLYVDSVPETGLTASGLAAVAALALTTARKSPPA